ncbi:hypothetical protein G6F59_018277 [Rhizopus arrhizus]|nr:hypothetical protein G6F59_018277 [Rhizopus arrhizus]
MTTSASVSPRVHGTRGLADFDAAFHVQQRIDAGTGADAHVMVALGAHMQIGCQVFAVQHRFARRAFHPKAFGHAAGAAVAGLIDARRQEFFDPAH